MEEKVSINTLQFKLNQKLKKKNDFFDFVKDLLLNENHTSLLDMINGHFFKEIENLYGQKFIKILKNVWKNTLNFTYETNPMKPAFRDKSNEKLYLYPAIYKLWCLLKVWEKNFNIVTLIKAQKVSHDCTIEDIIAYEINNKNDKLLFLFNIY